MMEALCFRAIGNSCFLELVFPAFGAGLPPGLAAGKEGGRRMGEARCRELLVGLCPA